MSETQKTGPRISYEFNIASVVQALIVAAVSAFLFVTNSASKVDATAQQLNSFRQEIVARLSEYQSDNKGKFDEISRIVAGLPDQSASLRQLEARVTRLETFKSERDKQMSDLNAMVVQIHADLSTIMNANRPKLGLRAQ
jgi:cell shape-determining protein MreC